MFQKSILLFRTTGFLSGCFFLLLLFSCVSGIRAQQFDAGLRFGLCASQVNGDRLSGFNKAGLLGGVYVKRKVAPYFSLGMEMVFIQKGSRKPTDDFNSFYRLRVHYVEVPVLLYWEVSRNFTFTGGPSFGTLVFSQEDDEFGAYPNPAPFRKYELAANAGLIYRLSDSWSFDGRFSQSLSVIRPFPGAYNRFFDKGQYNVVIEFSLLYGF
jgi:hypothetical protein